MWNKKIINGKKCKIAQHLDDSKMSHADPKVLTEILQAMKCYFNKIAIRRGENHDLFGVIISMNRKE